MGTKFTLAGLNLMYQRSPFISKSELTQPRGVRPMVMCDSVSVKNFIVPVLHLKICLGNDVLINLIASIYSDVEKLLQVRKCPKIHW